MKNIKPSFSLIELIITISILGLLSSITLFILNPTTITDSLQDHKRVSDLNNIAKAMDYLDAVSMNMTDLGNTNIVYLSLPDNTSSTCGSYIRPSLPEGYTYSCKNSTDYRKNDGTGWIPVALREIDNTSLISTLPVDPVNNGIYYYSYFPGGLFELTSLLTQARDASINDGGLSTTLYEVGGTDRKPTPILRDQELLAYYSFDSSDTEDTVFDHSGSNNTGTWNGTGEKYDHTTSSKKVAKMNGENDDVNIGKFNKNFSIFTISLWIKLDTISPGKGILGKWSGDDRSFLLRTGTSDGRVINFILSKDGTMNETSISEINSPPISDAGWYFITVIYKGKTDGHSIAWMYIDGEEVNQKNNMKYPIYESDSNASIGYGDDTRFSGKTDEIRLYNRILDSKEIKALFDKTKVNYK